MKSLNALNVIAKICKSSYQLSGSEWVVHPVAQVVPPALARSPGIIDAFALCWCSSPTERFGKLSGCWSKRPTASRYLAEVGAVPRLRRDVPHESPLHRAACQENDLCPYMNIDVKTAGRYQKSYIGASNSKSHPSVPTVVRLRCKD
jgi:hypothetical protein